MQAATGTRRRLSSALPGWLLAPLFVLLTAAATVQQSSPYKRGERIEITGTVLDAAGAPVEGVTVVLLAAHRGFKLRGFRQVEEGQVRVPTRTDAQGQFRLEWRWDPYYDVFRIRAEGARTAAGAGGSEPDVLAEVDLDRRIGEGSPVVVALAVDGGAPPRQERADAADPQPSTAADPQPSTAVVSAPSAAVVAESSAAPPESSAASPRPSADTPRPPAETPLPSASTAPAPAAASPPSATIAQSDDERRVFEEMGKPDRVDRLEMPGGDETAWWYFERGKSFHFRGGRLDQVVEFDPVPGR